VEDYQARGYILEYEIRRLLKKFGYINIKTAELRGRGANHQIDAYGELSIPTAFMYPIRLICECKCYSDFYPVQLHHVRSFVGVIKDISENYIVDMAGNRSTPHRYTDVGCFFSASPFTKDAQEYAWAHNIFIISFSQISLLKPIIQRIRNFVKNYSTSELKDMTKSRIIKEYESAYDANINKINTERDITIAIGIIDGIYPVSLVSEGNWLQNINEEQIYGVKMQRISNEFDTVFNLIINNSNIQFSIPNTISLKLIERIDKSSLGDVIFEIDVPYLKMSNDVALRRFLKIVVSLPDHNKSLYIEDLKKYE
jgi:hypothetical protein